MKLVVTMYGDAGAGKDEAGRGLARELGCVHMDMGDMLREVASEHGLTLEELHDHARSDRQWDDELDDCVRQLPDRHERVLIVSRTAWYLHPRSLKVYLRCKREIGAQRVMGRLLREGRPVSFDKVLRMNDERITNDAARYREYLGIATYPPPLSVFDVVVDTSLMPELEVLAELAQQVKRNVKYVA